MLQSIVHSCKADYLDRVRNHQYLVVLMAMSVLTMLFFPAQGAAYQTLAIGPYRGFYNSAWVGDTLAAMSVAFLPLICFYLIKNSINRDRHTGVGELVAATNISKFSLITGKWCANVLLLLGIQLCMLVTALFVQLWHGESTQLQVWQLLSPQLVYVLPLLLLVAALAVLFEAVPWLSRGLGNIVYFFVWAISLVSLLFDALALNHLLEQMAEQVQQLSGNPELSVNVGLSAATEQAHQRFTWTGISYDSRHALAWLCMLGLTAVTLVAASLSFDRFTRTHNQQAKPELVWLSCLIGYLLAPFKTLFYYLTDYSGFTRLVRLEFLLLTKGASVWWLSLIMGLIIAQLFVSVTTASAMLLPAAWLLCVLMLSQLGAREYQQHTDQLVFSCPSSFAKQLLAMWLAATLLLLGISAVTLFKALLAGNWASLLVIISGAVFVSALAITCGVLTKSNRAFEVVFVILWYVGPVNRLVWADFIGVQPSQSMAMGMPLIFAATALALCGVAYGWRRVK